jgi:hypothetical protein
LLQFGNVVSHVGTNYIKQRELRGRVVTMTVVAEESDTCPGRPVFPSRPMPLRTGGTVDYVGPTLPVVVVVKVQTVCCGACTLCWRS